MLIIYGNELCSYCRRAKKLADQYHLSYEWKDTDIQENHNELKKLKPESKTIPQIWWNGNYIGGYDDLSVEIQNTIGGYGEQLF